MDVSDDEVPSQVMEQSEDEEGSDVMFSPPEPSYQADEVHPNGNFKEQFQWIKCRLLPKESAAIESLETCMEFNDVLGKISAFIAEAFSTITKLLELGKSDPSDIPRYLQNSVEVLKLLTERLKEFSTVGELNWARFRALPTSCARIILHVFQHCRSSESVYGASLRSVETQLKELFQSCHELQLSYLDVMQNRLAVQVTDQEEVAILSTAIRTNIDIGEVAIHLDVKTMAEQWKAFTGLCEKYWECLIQTDVAATCLDVLCAQVLEDIEACLSEELEHKALYRSLKVSSFLIKIIIKMCQIFKKGVTKNYKQIVKLLIAIKGKSEVVLRAAGKPEALVRLVTSHVGVAAEPLLAELLAEPAFALALMSRRAEGEATATGRLLLLASAAEGVVARDDATTRHAWLGEAPACNLVCCILDVMRYCHVLLNCGGRLECWRSRSEAARGCGPYEVVAAGACALAATSTREQHAAVQRGALAALLQRDCWAAALAADLLVALARYGPTDLCVQQVHDLIYIHERYTRRDASSPQCVYLSSTIRRLVSTLPDAARAGVQAGGAWGAGGAAGAAELTALRARLAHCRFGREFGEDDFLQLLDAMRAAARCVPLECAPARELAALWLRCRAGGGAARACAVAASALTAAWCRAGRFDNEQLVQILDALSSIINRPSCAMKLCAIRIASGLAYYKVPDDAHTAALGRQLARLYRHLLTDDEPVVRARALSAFQLFCHHTNQQSFILEVVADSGVRRSVIHFIKTGALECQSELPWTEQLRRSSQYVFVHECVAPEPPATPVETERGNFEKPALDDLFNDNDFEEPAQVKLDCRKMGEVLSRLENDVILLQATWDSAHSEDYSERILKLIENLKSIVL